jgi:hypothetical protein
MNNKTQREYRGPPSGRNNPIAPYALSFGRAESTVPLAPLAIRAFALVFAGYEEGDTAR